LNLPLSSTTTTSTTTTTTTLFSSNNTILFDEYSIEQLEKKFENESIEQGGHWKPRSITKNKIAIIIPYRDRLKNLQLFLLNMPLFLQRQNCEFVIYLIEPIKGLKFSRSLLSNIGYLEALKSKHNWNCFFFHDVDMLPQSNLNIYKCDNDVPVHYSVVINFPNKK